MTSRLSPPTQPHEAAPAVQAADPDLDEDLARWDSPVPVAPKVTLLGPVTVRTLGDATATAHRRPYYVEFLAYLALHPNGVTAEKLAEDLCIRPQKARSDLSIIRKWLGQSRAGKPYLPRAQQTHQDGVPATYALDGVLCDLDLFRRLRARGQSRGADGMADLVSALHLVSGEPFTDLRKDGWGWLLEGDRLDHIMTAAIVDVGHIVTTHALAVGDLDLADFASQRRARRVAVRRDRDPRPRRGRPSHGATLKEPTRGCGTTSSTAATTTTDRSNCLLEPRKSSKASDSQIRLGAKRADAPCRRTPCARLQTRIATWNLAASGRRGTTGRQSRF